MIDIKKCPLCTKNIGIDNNICPYCGYEFSKQRSSQYNTNSSRSTQNPYEYPMRSKPDRRLIDAGMVAVFIVSFLGAIFAVVGKMASESFVAVTFLFVLYFSIYFIILYIFSWLLGKIYPNSYEWGVVKWIFSIFVIIILLSIIASLIFGIMGSTSTSEVYSPSPIPSPTINYATIVTPHNYVIIVTPYQTIARYSTPTRYIDPRPLTGTIVKESVMSRGEGDLTIDNIQGGTDAVAVLTYYGSKNSLTSVYIRKGGTTTIQNIPDGNYNLYFASGGSWNPDTLKFEVAPSYTKFEDIFSYSTTTTQAMRWRITLYSVVNGNANSEDVSEFDFPN